MASADPTRRLSVPRRPIRTGLADRRWVGPGLLVLVLLAAGCSRTPLPAAGPLLMQSSRSMGEVSSVRFAMDIDGIVAPFTFRSVKGVLTRSGNASGSVTLVFGDNLSENQYVLLGKDLYLRGATGPYQLVPSELSGNVYDPKILLAPEHGLPSVLAGATETKTEGVERVAGVDTYRIRARVTPELLQGLTNLEAGQSRVPATMWIDGKTDRLVRALVTFRTHLAPEDTKLTLTLTQFDRPVDIKPPPT
jgi:lipoprotein LprG